MSVLELHKKLLSGLGVMVTAMAFSMLSACSHTDEMDWPMTWPVQPAYLESGCAPGEIDCIESERRRQPL